MPMRILFANRPLKAWIGGDGVQCKETMMALKKRGIQVEMWEDMLRPPKDINNYDLIHCFGINFYWSKETIRQCIFMGKPYVISAIFYPEEYDNTFPEMKLFSEKSLLTIVNSKKEKEEMMELLNINGDKIKIIPNGVNKEIFKKLNTEKDNYVVSIGRLQPQKGIDLLINACWIGGYKLRYISSECRGGWAEEQRKKIDDYYENISQEKVAELLNKSNVYVNPSLSERQSLGVLEACACGLPVVDSIYNRGADYLPSSLIINPCNTKEMAEAIKKIYNRENNDYVMSWDEVADLLIKEYENLGYNANS